MRSKTSALGVKTNYFKNWIKQWIWFILSIIFIWVITVFAANWYDSLTSNAWDPLTATKWNNLVKATVPTGAVMAFNLSTCPNWWLPADWTNSTPDLRWEFIRWLDNWRWVDTGRVLGSSQNPTRIRTLIDNYTWYAIWTFAVSAWNIETNWWSATVPEWTIVPFVTLNNLAYYQATATQTVWSWDNWAFATRPRNVALLYCVKQ